MKFKKNSKHYALILLVINLLILSIILFKLFQHSKLKNTFFDLYSTE